MDIQDFFMQHHYISLREVAERAGINHSLLRQYACGLKTPSSERIAAIQKAVRAIGNDLSKAKIES